MTWPLAEDEEGRNQYRTNRGRVYLGVSAGTAGVAKDCGRRGKYARFWRLAVTVVLSVYFEACALGR
jgi:hypothetical protein